MQSQQRWRTHGYSSEVTHLAGWLEIEDYFVVARGDVVIIEMSLEDVDEVHMMIVGSLETYVSPCI